MAYGLKASSCDPLTWWWMKSRLLDRAISKIINRDSWRSGPKLEENKNKNFLWNVLQKCDCWRTVLNFNFDLFVFFIALRCMPCGFMCSGCIGYDRWHRIIITFCGTFDDRTSCVSTRIGFSQDRCRYVRTPLGCCCNVRIIVGDFLVVWSSVVRYFPSSQVPWSRRVVLPFGFFFFELKKGTLVRRFTITSIRKGYAVRNGKDSLVQIKKSKIKNSSITLKKKKKKKRFAYPLGGRGLIFNIRTLSYHP